MKWILCLLLVAMLGVLAFWGFRAQQVFTRQLQEFVPTPYDASTKGRALLVRARRVAREVEWTLADGTRQIAWFIPPRNGAVILYAHGSPGQGLSFLDGEAQPLVDRGYGALLIDLPGYGLSEGNRAWDDRFIESFRRGIDFALAQQGVDPTRIGAFGYSNGACLVARVAAQDERLSALVLLASYTRLSDQLHHTYQRRTPGLGWVAIAASLHAGVPVSELDTLAALERMAARPTLIIWGGRDTAIPNFMGPILQSAVHQAEGVQYDDVGHLGYFATLGTQYAENLDRFYTRALGIKTANPPAEPAKAILEP
jgi:pimeloyl-ACP methyl ester carboxylesterase